MIKLIILISVVSYIYFNIIEPKKKAKEDEYEELKERVKKLEEEKEKENG